MQTVYAIFVNKKDVLDETSSQHYIYKDIMNQIEKEYLKEFTDDSILIIPHTINADNIECRFYIIMRDTNVNCEAFFNGIFGLYNLISDIEPEMITFIRNNGLIIDLAKLTEFEDYVTSEMVENLFSLIFNDRRKA